MIWDDWQKEVLDYDDGNILLCTGRQVGKTTIFSEKAARRMLERKTSIVVVSLSEDQAKLIIAMVLNALERRNKTAVCKGRDKPTQSRIKLKNGSHIISRPVGQTGGSVRGFTADILIIDEASRFPQAAFVAAKPVLLTTGGQIWLCSTPAGKHGYFWEAYQNKAGRFKVWHISSEDVIKNRKIGKDWTEKQREAALQLLKDEQKEMSELEYGQEYRALFLEDLQRFFPDSLIEKCCILKKTQFRPINAMMGVDIARMGGDECAYEVVYRLASGNIHQIDNVTKTKQPTTRTIADILTMNSKWSPKKIGIDAGAGSLGVGIYDFLREEPKTKRKIVPMNNRAMSMDRSGKMQQRLFKEDMYDLMKSLMEQGKLFFFDDPAVKASLSSVQMEFTEGTVSKVRIFGKYTHIAEGLVRAVYLAQKEKGLSIRIHYM